MQFTKYSSKLPKFAKYGPKWFQFSNYDSKLIKFAKYGPKMALIH